MAGMIRRALHRTRVAASALKNPPWTSSGHFYSPLTSREDVGRALRLPPVNNLVDLRIASQEQLLARLAPMWKEFQEGPRWTGGSENTQYGLADAAVYTSMLRLHEPNRVVEVGSGYSSAVALDARERYGLSTSLTFIEPYTRRLDTLITTEDRASTTIRQECVQDTPMSVFETLTSGDLLFIDSSHVVKAGSDVEHLLFRVLPGLPSGVIVHVHDCFWPWQYPENWLRQRRDWNELYLFHAFLANNSAWEIMLFSDWAWTTHRGLVKAHLPAALAQRPGSLWIRKTEAPAST
jgi:hypothetical protein